MLLSRLGSAYVSALDGMRRILRDAWADFSGVELGTEGDSCFVVFEAAQQAVGAVVRAQRRLGVFPWPGGEVVRVRMGVHTGAPSVHDGGYVGMDVHRAARIAGAAHGGQVVISAATAGLVADDLPDGIRLRDLGMHRFKDLGRREHVLQLTGAGLESGFPPLRSLGAASSLPEPPTPTVGRSGELTELADALAAPGVRLLTLTGAGGSGKTRLATELARRVVDEFPDGVYFVALASATTPEMMWMGIAEALDVPPEGRAPPSLFSHVRHRSALMLLDNLEQLQGADAVVAELMAQAPRLTVIATSRRPLHLPAEYEHPVPPLELPTDDTIAHAEASGAGQLFVQYARKVRPSFRLTERNVGDVAVICQRLDGLPLAIELAAARAKLLSPAALVARLDTALDMKALGSQAPSRQRTLRDTIAWSYDLLTPELQRIFRQLSVFSGGAELDAINAVTTQYDDADHEDSLGAVADLVDASLVVVTESPNGEPRIRMLETVRSFAHAELTARDEVDEARRRHAHHYIAVAEQISSAFDGARYWQARAQIDAEDDNIRDSFNWALPADQPTEGHDERAQTGLRLCTAVSEWGYELDFFPSEGRKWLERALERASDHDSTEVAACLRVHSQLLIRSGAFQDAYRYAKDSVAMSRRLRDPTGTIWGLWQLATVDLSRQHFASARPMMEEALALARQSGSSKQLHAVLQRSAMLEGSDDNLPAALDLSTEALAIAQQLGAPNWALLDRQNVACTLRQLGRVEDAHELMRQVIPDALKLLLPYHLMTVAEDYAAVLAELGRYRLAARLLGASDAMYERTSETRDPRQQTEIADALAKARRAMSPQEWNDAYDAGRSASIDDALMEAHAADSLRSEPGAKT